MNPMAIVSIGSFIWKEVVPVVKQIIKIVGLDTYDFIKEQVSSAEHSDMNGFTKRFHVFTETTKYLKDKGIEEVDVFGMAVVYFLIELAVMNLKKKGKESKKTKK